jgi:hypothetical protein
MTVDEIIKRVETVNTESNYWFVRTDYGQLFEDFIKGNYIAINWDYITLNDLKNNIESIIRDRISKKEEINIETQHGKGKVSNIYNKIQTFISLKKDDIVIIPSRNSDRLAFGRIADDKAYEEVNAKEFLKRRKIEWYEIKYTDDLNPIFYQVKSNQHTISSIDRFAPHIDRVIGNLFKKGDNTHYVLNIEKTDDINFNDIATLMDNIKILINNINQEFAFNENLGDFYIKINLQSKGALELIKKGRSLAVLAYLMHLISCNNVYNERDAHIEQFIVQNKLVLESTSNVIDSLKMNTNEITKPFKNGN